jgi:uncharacterized protein (TIGR03435 family)
MGCPKIQIMSVVTQAVPLLPLLPKWIRKIAVVGRSVAAMFVFPVVALVGQPPAAVRAGNGARFEVASVRQCDPHSVAGHNGGTTSPGRVAYNCQTLLDYIRSAYGIWGSADGKPKVNFFNVVGGPPWINTDLFQITATTEGSLSSGETAGPMMQALLEERFKVKVHREVRTVPVYALVLTKARLRLPVAKVECFTGRPSRPKEGEPLPSRCGTGQRTENGIEIHGSTMADFCVALCNIPLRLDRRKFIDKTGITGRFDFDLKFPIDDLSTINGEHPLRSDDFARLQGALQSVGLQLTSTNGPDEFIVIDHAERPTAN